MKNSIKIFILSIFTFLVGITIADAKQLTYEQLQEEIEKINPYAVEARIIGKYVFTDANPLTDQDIMAGAVSIDGIDDKDYSEDLYNKLTINRLVRKINTSTGNYENWGIVGNLVGKTNITESSKFDIRWIDKKFIPEVSKTEINVDVDDSKYQTYKTVLETKLNFKTADFYGTYDGAKKLKIDGNKISGLLLKKSVDNLFFNEDDKTKYANVEYYFAYVLEVPNADENVSVNIKGLNGETKTATWNEFDVQTGTPGIVILVPVDKTKWETNKEITITVDADGETNKNYEPTEYKLDLSGLKFQEESEAGLTTENLPSADVKSISDDWGYTKGELDTYELKNGDSANKYKLTGTIVKQIIKDNVFPEDEKTGYYFLLSVGQNIDESLYGKATVTYPGNKGTKKSVITDATGVTILFSTSDENKKKSITINVDLDGDGDEYLPVNYEIDLSELTLEKTSKFSVLDISKGGLVTNPLESEYGWKQPENYDVKFETSGTTVKVTGLLPILDSFSDEKHPFGEEDETGYYLPFVIKTDVGNKTTYENVTVQFIHEGEESKTLTAENFDGENVLYILRHLDKNAKDKSFKIVVDMDGVGTEYTPYEITFDWSELDLQTESGVDAVLVDPNATDNTTTRGYISNENKEEITSWGYDFSNMGENIQLEKEDLNNYKLTGIVKEQNVESAGFKKPDGYYVPIKIYGPNFADIYKNHFLSQLEGNKKWTIYVKDENENYREVTPSADDYKNGYIVVLFKLKDDEDKKITYKVDWDGSKSNVFLEEEVTIDYNELQHKALNKITYNYKDAEGKDQSELAEVYQNEPATLKDLKEINSDYRTFDGWYKSDNTKVEDTLTINEDKDETLTAHWKLDADAFVKAVMEDLNAKEETSEKFNLTMDDSTNTITINVKDSRVLLNEMNNTNIPGAIAYILQKGEVTGVTLSTGYKKVEFTKDGANNEVVSKISLDAESSGLKDKIKAGAKALFQEVLDDSEKTMTLSKMALIDSNFTLEISSNDKNVTLKDAENKAYTFEFETEAVTVTNEEELKTALTKDKITHIFLGNNIEVENQLDVNRSVTINGDGKYKISVKDNKKDSVDSIFKVSTSGVTINNIELSGAKNAIIVEGEEAELKTTGLTLSEISESGIKTIKGDVSATGVTFVGEAHDIPTAKVVREQRGQRVNANVSIANSTQNDPIYIGVKKHNTLWCADQGDNYGKEDSNIVQSCDSKSRSDDYDITYDTYYYINNGNIKDYVIVNFMESFTGGTMGLSKIYEKGQNIDTFDEYIGKVKVQDSKTNKEYYFVGYGTGRKITSDITSGAVYFKNLMDLTTEKAEDGKWHFAYYAERDDNKYVTLDDSAKEVEGYNANAKYYTYKFKDTESGMTIGQLKTIDKDFAEMWSKLNEKAKGQKKAVNYDKDGQEETATDSTVINMEIKLKIGDPVIEKP